MLGILSQHFVQTWSNTCFAHLLIIDYDGCSASVKIRDEAYAVTMLPCFEDPLPPNPKQVVIPVSRLHVLVVVVVLVL